MEPWVENVLRPKPVSRDQMTRFHSDDYINFLRVINPDNMSEYLRHLQRCKDWRPAGCFHG